MLTNATQNQNSSNFNHQKHIKEFLTKKAPKKLIDRSFIFNESDKHYYTYEYKEMQLKEYLKFCRKWASKCGLDRRAFESYKINKNVKCIRISEKNYTSWKKAYKADVYKIVRLSKRIFKYDDINKVYYTTPLKNEILYNVYRQVYNKLTKHSEKCTTSNDRVELSKSAYNYISITCKKRIATHRRKFDYEEKTKSYNIYPLENENIRDLGSVLRTSAHRVNMATKIFESLTDDKGARFYRIKEEDYNVWQHRCTSYVRHYIGENRIITKSNNHFIFKLKKDEHSNQAFMSIKQFLYKLERNNKITNEIRSKITGQIKSDPKKDRVTITEEGKRLWETHIISSTKKRKKPQDISLTAKSISNSPILIKRNKQSQTKRIQLASHYQRNFIIDDGFYYTTPREDETLEMALYELNRLANNKLQKKESVFSKHGNKIRISEDNYYAWRNRQGLKSTIIKRRSISTGPAIKISQARQHIADKYLFGVPKSVIPKSKRPKRKRLPESATLKFKQLKEILLDSDKQKHDYHHFTLENDNKRYQCCFIYAKGSDSLKDKNNNVIFVRGGRKLAATVPCFERGSTNNSVVVIMTSKELNEAHKVNAMFESKLPRNVQIFEIKSCYDKSEQTYMPINQLRMSNIKRKVALLLATNDAYNIRDYVLMDDNIDVFLASKYLSTNIKITADDLFNIFRNTAKLYSNRNEQKPLCITVGTYAPHKNIPRPLVASFVQELKPYFGAKVMYHDAAGIKGLAHLKKVPLNQLCSFNDLTWGEDYFFQHALRNLSSDDFSILGRIPFEVGCIKRTHSHRNAARSVPDFKLANHWSSSSNEIESNSTLSDFQKRTARLMKSNVEKEISIKKKQAKHLATQADTKTTILSAMEQEATKAELPLPKDRTKRKRISLADYIEMKKLELDNVNDSILSTSQSREISKSQHPPISPAFNTTKIIDAEKSKVQLITESGHSEDLTKLTETFEDSNCNTPSQRLSGYRSSKKHP